MTVIKKCRHSAHSVTKVFFLFSGNMYLVILSCSISCPMYVKRKLFFPFYWGVLTGSWITSAAPCRSWDEFHTCVNVVLAGCPDEAAAVWESLRQESKKMQFSGNLYDMCANRAQPTASMQSPPSQQETNQESLKGRAPQDDHTHLVLLAACLLCLWLHLSSF